MVNDDGHFKLKINGNDYFGGTDTYTCLGQSKGIVTSNPTRKWYQRLFQFITFGIYKAPYTYTFKIIKYYELETT